MIKFVKKSGAMLMASAMMASTMVSAFAATSTATNNNTATTNDLTNADIIDESKKGSITIHKYDITSAEKDGAYTQGLKKATGEQDTDLENTLKKYQVEGVEFTYLKCGDIEQYSAKKGDTNSIQVVYEVPKELATILELNPADAYDMTEESVANKCDKTDVYHYNSTQISDALQKILDADNVAAKNALEGYIAANPDAVKMAKTDSTGTTSAKNLDLGLYLIVETEVPEEVVDTVNPWFATLPFTQTSAQTAASAEDGKNGKYDKDATKGGNQWLYDLSCYPKNQTGNPTLDKLVRNAYNTSNDYRDKNTTVSTADKFESDFAGKNLATSMVVFNSETNVKADDTDAASYINNRGGYTKDNQQAGEAKYSSDYTYDSSTTASEGDVLDYLLVSKLPHIASKSTYLSQYTFVDKLSEGLMYNDDIRIAFYDNETDAKVNNTKNAMAIWGRDGEGSTFNSKIADVTVSQGENKKTTGTTLTVSFTEDGLKAINEDGLNRIVQSNTEPGTAKAQAILTDRQKQNAAQGVTNSNAGLGDMYVVVYYTATMNSDARAVLGDSGNPNDVVLTWERSSQGFYNTLEDRCYVYTYGINLTKKFDGGTGDATKVKFVLYDETDGYYVVATKTETKDGKLVYYVTGKSASQDGATQFSPDSNGAMIINGLEGDKYQLTETETDDGFNLAKDQIVIDITTATRAVDASVAGYVGKVDANHTHTDDCYAKDATGQKIQYTDAAGQKHDIFVCGHTDADANGRTTGKTDMNDHGVVASKTTRDGVASQMENYVINEQTVLSTSKVGSTIDSENGLLPVEVTNHKKLKMPLTGSAGVAVFATLGVVAIAGGVYACTRKKKNDSVDAK